MKEPHATSEDAYAVFQKMFAQHEIQMKAMISELHAQHEVHSCKLVHQAIREALGRFATPSVDFGKADHALEQKVFATPNSSVVPGLFDEPLNPSYCEEVGRPCCPVLDKTANGEVQPPRFQNEATSPVVNNFMAEPHNNRNSERNPKTKALAAEEERLQTDKTKPNHEQGRSSDSWAQIEPISSLEKSTSQPRVKRSATQYSKYHDIDDSRVTRLVKSSLFDSTMAIIIVLSAIFIFVQTEWASQNPEASTPVVFRVAEVCFTIIFSIELGLKIAALRRSFFTGPDKGWHLMDSVVVVTAFIELVAASSLMKNMVVLRLLRILRIVRVTRILRALKVFTNLRMMVMGIVSCGSSLVWAIVLLFIIILVFATCLTQVVSSTLAEGTARDSPEEEDALRTYFGSLFRTVYWLFKAVTGGVSWGEVADPLLVISPSLCVLFCLFLVFVTFAVLNIITGIFVENSFKSVDSDREMKRLEYADIMESKIQAAKKVFTSLDADQSGFLDWEEFKCNYNDESLQAYFEELDLDIHTEDVAQHLFHELDFDQSGSVGIDEFFGGLARLKGPARSIDMARVLHNMKLQDDVLLSIRRDIGALSSMRPSPPEPCLPPEILDCKRSL